MIFLYFYYIIIIIEMNKNIQLIINRINKKSIVINVNPYLSIYSIKVIISKNTNFPIKDINLKFNNKILRDNKSVIHYKLKDKSIIYLNEGKIKGGIEYTEIIGYIYVFLSIVIIPVFTLFIMSGLNVLFSQVYKLIVTKCIKSIYNLFTSTRTNIGAGVGASVVYLSEINSSTLGKLTDSISGSVTSLFGTILHYFGLFLEYGSLYFFNYIGTALCFFPLIYLLNNDLCDSTILADKVGYYVSIVFIIIYGIYRSPKIIISNINSYFRRNPLLAFFSPLMVATKKLSSHITFDPIYAIPIIGQLLLGYHSIIGISIDTLNYGASYIRGINLTCDGLNDPQNKDQVNKVIDKILPLFSYLLMLDEAVKKQNNRKYDIVDLHVPSNIQNEGGNKPEIFKISLDSQKDLIKHAKKYIDQLVYYSANSVAPIVRDWHAERYISLFKYSFIALIGLPLNHRIKELEKKYDNIPKPLGKLNSAKRMNAYNIIREDIDNNISDIYDLETTSNLMYLPTVGDDGILNYSETYPLPITEIKVGDKSSKKDILKSIAKCWVSMLQRYNSSGFIERFSDPELLDVMFSQIGYKTVCSLLDSIQSVADIIIDSGNPFDLTDMICSGNIAGIGAGIAIIVLFIMILVYHFFSWKLFGKKI